MLKKEEREDRLSSKKKKKTITVYNTPGVEKISNFHFTAKIMLSIASFCYS